MSNRSTQHGDAFSAVLIVRTGITERAPARIRATGDGQCSSLSWQRI
ncbi:hypothetical protein PXO_02829 [Xanthomonas oryzae pv. oryzae PXO99A]|uniref:Uncharacterized protein n=1 Tax=Xanthomonas oryzae pv. oryzae (strain PXO99A) TaxID=360094 RepID=A0A0K0GR82_XANOP|nr:hypothetical protein PXO_02829 [Xanthomonas oryzae pv. oryzae PXO99A]